MDLKSLLNQGKTLICKNTFAFRKISVLAEKSPDCRKFPDCKKTFLV